MHPLFIGILSYCHIVIVFQTQLGCYAYDQKKVDDVQQFQTDVHEAYVPNHSNKDDENHKPSQTMLFADYLGFERQKCGQSQLQDERTPSKRLEGLVAGLSDFHAQAEWHKVMVHVSCLL